MSTDVPESDDSRSQRNVWLVPCMAARRDLVGGGTLWLDTGGAPDTQSGEAPAPRSAVPPA